MYQKQESLNRIGELIIENRNELKQEISELENKISEMNNKLQELDYIIKVILTN